ncbi:MAG TPA: DUF1854 domain-containing protein [Clostridia bacterium]|nr:DUF1854 domain-containing protein [Clostridia bacterium]
MQNVATNLADAIDVGYLDVRKAKFFTTEGGFTGLTYDGKEYRRVSLRRALPIGQPDAYISVADAENKEIGILRDLSELSDIQFQIVAAELARRYYCPVIVAIKSVKDKLGYVYMEITIKGEGRTYDLNCAVKDVNKNIRMLDDDRLIIFDVDGNRYLVESLSKLDQKSVKRLEPYLF